jgi:hypothetical protein
MLTYNCVLSISLENIYQGRLHPVGMPRANRGGAARGALRQQEVMRTLVESQLWWVRYAKFHPDEMYFAPVELKQRPQWNRKKIPRGEYFIGQAGQAKD